MIKDLVEALDEAEVHALEFEAFDEVLRGIDGAKVDEWCAMIEAWYCDSKCSACPFEMPPSSE
jgi:hypothetical protein